MSARTSGPPTAASPVGEKGGTTVALANKEATAPVSSVQLSGDVLHQAQVQVQVQAQSAGNRHLDRVQHAVHFAWFWGQQRPAPALVNTARLASATSFELIWQGRESLISFQPGPFHSPVFLISKPFFEGALPRSVLAAAGWKVAAVVKYRLHW